MSEETRLGVDTAILLAVLFIAALFMGATFKQAAGVFLAAFAIIGIIARIAHNV